MNQTMKLEEINIRDPYILKAQGHYFMYGTRSATTWGPADGFDCYESQNLKDWEGPFEIYHRPDGSEFDHAYWAPECYEHQGKYYLITTLGATDRKKGVYALVSDSPKGPFTLHSEGPLTPADWCCIDGSLYFEGEEIYLIFSHSFEDTPDGDMAAIKIAKDLKKSEGEPFFLFSAKDAPWVKPVPFAKAEFGMDGEVFFTDGPCAHRLIDGTLAIIWSSWSERGYAVGMAVSDDGTIRGNWEHRTEKLVPGNAGHGMMFSDYEGKQYYTLHFPNDKYAEHPVLFEIVMKQSEVKIEGQEIFSV